MLETSFEHLACFPIKIAPMNRYFQPPVSLHHAFTINIFVRRKWSVQSEFVKCGKVEIWNEESLGTLASDHLCPKPAPFYFTLYLHYFTLYLHHFTLYLHYFTLYLHYFTLYLHYFYIILPLFFVNQWSPFSWTCPCQHYCLHYFYIILSLFLRYFYVSQRPHVSWTCPCHHYFLHFLFSDTFQIGQRENIYDLESNQSEIERTVFWWINKAKTSGIGIHTVNTQCVLHSSMGCQTNTGLIQYQHTVV